MTPRPEETDLPLHQPPRLPRDRPLGIGCIGAGFIMDECHLVAYRAAGLNPVAIAARRAERAVEVARRHRIAKTYDNYAELLADPRVEVVDIAVPPDVQLEVIREVVRHADHVRGVLAQKPLGVSFAQARQIVQLCDAAGIVLAVNQNMRYDQSVRACKALLAAGELGAPVLATIDMRAIPHWAPWQARQGWVTLRIMSIHHLDTFRYWFGEPSRVIASVRTDPRTATQFDHEDGICLYILEYDDGMRAAGCDDVWTGPAREGAADDIGIRWRVEGTTGAARGTIGWPAYPNRVPSTLDFTSVRRGPNWLTPRWNEVWFPDAFAGPMAELLCAIQDGVEPSLSGRDNLHTMALVEACYVSAREHRAVEPREIHTAPGFAGGLGSAPQLSARPGTDPILRSAQNGTVPFGPKHERQSRAPKRQPIARGATTIQSVPRIVSGMSHANFAPGEAGRFAVCWSQEMGAGKSETMSARPLCFNHDGKTVRRFQAMAWIYLIVAGICEWGWPIGLKFAWTSEGVQPLPLFGAIISMGASGAFLLVAQQTIPMGTAYAVWTGIGAVGTFILGILFLGESAQALRFVCVGLIVAGIVGLKLVSKS